MEEVVDCISDLMLKTFNGPEFTKYHASLKVNVDLDKMFNLGYIKDPKGRPFVYYNPLSNIYWISCCMEFSRVYVLTKNGKTFLRFYNYLGEEVEMELVNGRSINTCLKTIFNETPTNMAKVVTTLDLKGYRQSRFPEGDVFGVFPLFSKHFENGQEYYIRLKNGVIVCGRIMNGKAENLLMDVSSTNDIIAAYCEMVDATRIVNAANILMSMKQATKVAF
jgi:hypothetical protein